MSDLAHARSDLPAISTGSERPSGAPADRLTRAAACRPWDTRRTMSQQNVELVRRAFQAFSDGGVEAVLPFFPPDVVWYTTNRWLEDSAYRGHDGMRRLAAAFSENFDEWGYEIGDLRDAQDRVVASVEMTARIKNSGPPISQRLGLLVSDFDGDPFGEIRAFPSWHEALKAVGQE